jgi:hypothetical protein
MSWIAIDLDTLNEAKVAALVDACDSAALAVGQSNRAAGLIQGVVNEIRNAVATCAGNRVDSDTTKIPASQRDLAVDLILARLKGALEMPLTEDERANVAERRRQLRDIAACALVVDQPDTPIAPEVESPGSVPSFTARTLEHTRDNQDGL